MSLGVESETKLCGMQLAVFNTMTSASSLPPAPSEYDPMLGPQNTLYESPVLRTWSHGSRKVVSAFDAEISLHAYRQNHTLSKRPRFRFADLDGRIFQWGELPHSLPLTPVSAQTGAKFLSNHLLGASHNSKIQKPRITQTRDIRDSTQKPDAPVTCTLPSRPFQNEDSIASDILSSSLSTRQASQSDPTSKSNNKKALAPTTTTIGQTKAEARISRPPVLYRPPNIAGGPVVRAIIPPIRSFRSSGSRKSLILGMDARRISDSSSLDGDMTDLHQRDRTLRALEGRADDGYTSMIPKMENTTDIFMKIAREDASNPILDGFKTAGEASIISRLKRLSDRRPMSTTATSYPLIRSPPQSPRRPSNQRETSRPRRETGERSAQQMTRELSYRSTEKDKPIPNMIIGDTHRPLSARAAMRPSLISSRPSSFLEMASDVGSASSRRRFSITDGSADPHARTSKLRAHNTAYGQAKAYNSSPLVPKSADHHLSDTHCGPESNTESSASTADAGTVWDELDDLKSRIHRLELTGKLPSGTMSRVSDERPFTATTNATTLSASPKRGSGHSVIHAEVNSVTCSPRDGQPILMTALSKIKKLVSDEVFLAIEAIATETLSLSAMMGAAGRQGPISSGASTIGGAGSSTATDRQLCKKVESINRSLTELCLALADENSQQRAGQLGLVEREKDDAVSPTTTRGAGHVCRQNSLRREPQPLARSNTCSRVPIILQHRRVTRLHTSALPSSHHGVGIPVPCESTGRKSSLVISRLRRADTEEPEEAPDKKAALLSRNRRAVTEEAQGLPREGQTSLLLRTRRKAEAEEETEARHRASWRATAQVNGLRSATREFSAPAATFSSDTTAFVSSAHPRRQTLLSSLNPRLGLPTSSASSAAEMARRLLERRTPESDTHSAAERLAEDRECRRFSLSQTSTLNRSGSVNKARSNCDSGIPSLAASARTSSERCRS